MRTCPTSNHPCINLEQLQQVVVSPRGSGGGHRADADPLLLLESDTHGQKSGNHLGIRQRMLRHLAATEATATGQRHRQQELVGQVLADRRVRLEISTHLVQQALGHRCFATLPTSAWKGNFRALSAAVTRLATLSEAGRITDSVVDEEIKRLQRMWRHHGGRSDSAEVDLTGIMGEQAASQLDLFDALQLQAVIQVCRQSNSLSDAGRTLYAVSRAAKAKPNDADRLKKYLTKFGVSWEDVSR